METFTFNSKIVLENAPNTACSGRWGFATFSGNLLRLSIFHSDGGTPPDPRH
jgi:hypothetical protein